MSEKIKYTWEYSDNNDIWQHGTFDTVEECVHDYLENYAVDIPQEYIFVGIVEPYKINIDSGNIIEMLEQQAFDECGEVAENWYPSSIKDNSGWEELDENITKMIINFLELHNEMPTFYNIVDVREVAVI